MKHILLFFTFFISFHYGHSQVVEDIFSVPTDVSYEYIYMQAIQRDFRRGKVDISISTGEIPGKNTSFDLKELIPEKEDAEHLVRALNILGKHGWEVVNVEVVSASTTRTQYILLKRKIPLKE